VLQQFALVVAAVVQETLLVLGVLVGVVQVH
jgi:hypothetical protein